MGKVHHAGIVPDVITRKDVLLAVQQWCLPWTCVLCARRGERMDLCRPCRHALPYNLPACQHCALPLARPIHAATTCRACQRQPPPWRLALCPLRYQAPVDHLLQGFKYHRQLAAGRVLSELLAHHVALSWGSSLPQAIVATPLHPRRWRQRGFNQAAEIARVLGRGLGLPVLAHCVVRTRNTPSQTQAGSAAERRAQVRGAFACRGVLPAHVAVVDDVVTSGATVAEMTQVLLAHGVRTVDVLALARRL